MKEKCSFQNKFIYRLISKLLELVFTGVVLAIVASLLTSHILEKSEINRTRETRLKNISNIYIGSNEEWINEKFGKPQFSSQKNDYRLCAYISEYYVIQILFDKSNSTKAYLITSLENDENIELKICDNTLFNGKQVSLNTFSYYDIEGDPMSVYGYYTNGTGRVFYCEEYYYQSGGNYYTYCYASLDYGKDGIPEQLDTYDKNKGFGIDDEVSHDKINGLMVLRDRHSAYPNTYGVATSSTELELLYDYTWFNSKQLFNRDT